MATLDLQLVMLSLKSRLYINCLTLQFCHLAYWKSIQHPVWNLICQFPHHFLEEDGEISLSLLCHAATAHSIQFDRIHLRTLYKLTNLYRQVAADTTIDLKIRVSRSKHHTVAATDPEVALLQAHFSEVIEALETSTWMHYPEITREERRYPTRAIMAPQMVNTSKSRIRLRNFRSAIRSSFRNIRRLLQGNHNNSTWIPEDPLSSSELSTDSTSSDNSHSTPEIRLQCRHRSPRRSPPPRKRKRSADSTQESSTSEEIPLHSNRRNRHHIPGPPSSAFSEPLFSTASSHSFYSHRYAIHAIRGARQRKKNRPDGSYELVTEYLVRWKNFPESDNETWEPEGNLREDCPDLLADYLKEASCSSDDSI